MDERFDRCAPEDGQLSQVAFVGRTLAPFFLTDPAEPEMALVLDALAASDAAELAREWPFGAREDALRAFGLLCAGAQEGARALSSEFRRLFVGPFAKAAPPWGSVYTDYDNVIFGKSELALHEWMVERGVRRLSDAREIPEDHVGQLLALAAWLAEERPELLDELLSLHFLPWAGHVFEEIERSTRSDFFRGAALLARITLEGLAAARGLVVEQPRFFR